MKLPQHFDPGKKAYALYEGVNYKEFWADLVQARRSELEKRIVKELLPEYGYRLIDIGCGYGRVVDTYSGRFQQVVLYDGCMDLLRQARKVAPRNAVAIAGDVFHLPFKRASFDAAILVRVVQHVKNLKYFFPALQRIISHEGRLVLSYYNKLNARDILGWLMSLEKRNPFSLESVEVMPTLIAHHPRIVSRALNDAGFSSPTYRDLGSMDRLASKYASIGKKLIGNTQLVRLLGMAKVSSWVFCRAISRNSALLASAKSLNDLLKCPQCGGDLACEVTAYTCPACCRSYPVADGIIDFRL